MATGRAKIPNMTTEEDANKIMTALESVWGISNVEVNLYKNEALFMYDERMAKEDDFKQAIVDTGYDIDHSVM